MNSIEKKSILKDVPDVTIRGGCQKTISVYEKKTCDCKKFEGAGELCENCEHPVTYHDKIQLSSITPKNTKTSSPKRTSPTVLKDIPIVDLTDDLPKKRSIEQISTQSTKKLRESPEKQNISPQKQNTFPEKRNISSEKQAINLSEVSLSNSIKNFYIEKEIQNVIKKMPYKQVCAIEYLLSSKHRNSLWKGKEIVPEQLARHSQQKPTEFCKYLFSANANTKTYGLKLLDESNDEHVCNSSMNWVVMWSLEFNEDKESSNYKVIVNEPTKEQSSKPMRKFGAHRFVSVYFNTEGKDRKDLERIYSRIWKHGFVFGNRNFEFCFWSPSQLREGRCYYFAVSGPGIKTISVDEVRKWSGKFEHLIGNLAKYAARLGQNCSRTTPTIRINPQNIKETQDIWLKDEIEADPTDPDAYCFTDGASEIGEGLRDEISKKLECIQSPSAFQARFGGHKGVWVSNPNIPRDEIRVRPSLTKFPVDYSDPLHTSFDVVKIADARPDIVFNTIALGVPVSFYQKLYMDYIDEILSLSTSAERAIEILQKELNYKEDEEELNLARNLLSCLLANNFKDPEIQKNIATIQKQMLKSVQEKGQIWMEQSYNLLGVPDNTRTLEYGQVFVNVKNKIYTGEVVVTRHPVLHPGDVRKLTAVNVPQLSHLQNVVVFPTKGKRPHQDEMNGGDNDGDIYFVSWHPEMLKLKPVNPLNYKDSKVKNKIAITGNLNTDMMNFFFDYQKGQKIGTISNLRRAAADILGPLNPFVETLALAEAQAIDAAKTGLIVESIPSHPDVTRFPIWMRVGPEANRIRTKSFLSEMHLLIDDKIHQLREIEKKTPVMDESLLIPGRETYENEASKNLTKYKREISNILKETEDSDKTGNNSLISSIVARHRADFMSTPKLDDKHVKGDPFLLDLERKRKASAYYYVTYKQDFNADYGPALSFCWKVCGDYLNKIKVTQDEIQSGITGLTVSPLLKKEFKISL